MRITNKKFLKNRRRFRSRVAVGRFECIPCYLCYNCRHGLPCARPFVFWVPF